VESDKDLVFEDCTDQGSLVALTAPDAKAKPGETKQNWNVGESVPFKYVGDKLVKPEPSCTYSMDEYVAYEPAQKGIEVKPDASGALSWTFEQTFKDPGPRVVHLYRYKACGGEPKLADVSCQRVTVQ